MSVEWLYFIKVILWIICSAIIAIYSGSLLRQDIKSHCRISLMDVFIHIIFVLLGPMTIIGFLIYKADNITLINGNDEKLCRNLRPQIKICETLRKI
jgi:hypothetical protein